MESGRDDDKDKGRTVRMIREEYGEYSGEENLGKDGSKELLYSGEGVSFSDRE